jgi:argininosuccinate lyase
MSDQPDNLVLHHLKALRHDIDTRLDKLIRSHENLTAEVRVSNAHVAALVQNEVHTSARLAEIEVRLDRVERRLELADEPPKEG